MTKRKRVIGTTREAINLAEDALGVRLPPLMVDWLLQQNGTGDVFPIPDPREPRTLTGNMLDERENLLDYIEDCGGTRTDFAELVPIASVGNGDVDCLDFTNAGQGEIPIVIFCHETLATARRTDDFVAFLNARAQGDLEDD
jgi:hypothetical protein